MHDERRGEAAAEFLFIGELARQTGTDPKTIRYYERENLLAPPRHGRIRTYLSGDVKRLTTVLALRRMGLPIAEIRGLLNSTDPGADVLASHGTAAVLRSHLGRLRVLQGELAEQIARTSSLVGA